MLTSETILRDRYHLQHPLNASPSRQTWLAQDLDAQMPVVVKLLALGGPVQWDELKLFEREAQILKQLDHPRIPKYYDYFSLDERELWFGLVQQYIPGRSLKQRLDSDKTLSLEQVRRTLEDVLEILQYLHALHPPVLHRDIKPSNLLWGEDNRVYLLDFGAVQVRPPAAGSTFTVVGTYGYTPLEQFGGQSVPASDLYSLGATAIHLLTGIAPAELTKDDLRLQFRDRLAPGIEPRFASWLEKLTEPSPQKRFGSAKEALESLQCKPTVSNKAIPSRSHRICRLSKTRDRLSIEIPSRFEIEFLKPWQARLGKLGNAIGQWLHRSSDRAAALERQQRRALGIGSLLLVGFFALIASATGLDTAILALVVLPLTLLSPFVPLFVLILVLSALSGGDYWERTEVDFNPKTFEIWRKSSRGRRRECGEIAQIEEIYLTKWRDRGGNSHQGIAIATQTQRKVLFFSAKRDRQYLFGQHLSELELHWLAGEIQDWLNTIRTEPFNPFNSK